MYQIINKTKERYTHLKASAWCFTLDIKPYLLHVSFSAINNFILNMTKDKYELFGVI